MRRGSRNCRLVRRCAALGLAWALATPASAELLTWQMDSSEDQVKNSGVGDGSTDSTATGQSTLTYDTATGQFTYDISWNGLVSPLSNLHIHGPATPSQSTMVRFFDIFTAEQDVIDAGVDRTTDSVQGTVALADLVAATSAPLMDPGVVVSWMFRELCYVNTHSLMWPMGEIRGNFVLTGGTLSDTKAQAKCAQTNHKSLAGVSKKRAKELRGCVADAAKGKLAGTLEACVPGGSSAVFKAVDKAQASFAKKCEGFDKEGVPAFPLFAAADATAVTNAAVLEEERLLRSLWGDDLDAAIQQGDVGKCQDAVLKAAQKCEATALKEWSACDKNGRKGGKPTKTPPGTNAPFVSDADVEACFGFDPKGKVAKACTEKLTKTIDKKCGGVDLATAFGAMAAGDAASLTVSVNAAVDCKLCRMLNAADRLAMDCEMLDDGAANDSCPVAFQPPAP